MYFISKICLLCLNTNQVTEIVENNTYKQLLFVLPELNILAAENNSYICTTCQTSLKNFCIFKKLCIDNYYRWKSYKNLLHKNEVQSQNFCNMQVRLEKTIVPERIIGINNAELLSYNLHSELDIKPSQPIDNECENYIEEVNFTDDILEINNHHITINNSQLEQIPQIETVLNNIENDTNVLNNTSHVINKEHTNILAGPQKVKCNQCEKIFSSKEVLKKHNMSTHSTLKAFNCTLCHKSFALKGKLKVHMTVHEKKKFQCEHCRKMFGYKQTLQRHFKVCVKRQQTEEEPNKTVEHKKQKPKTNKEKQKESNENMSKIILTSLPNDLPSKLKLFFDLSCASPRKFNQLIQLELTQAEKTEILENMIKPAAQRTNKEFNCVICNKQMFSRKYLTTHIKTHKEVKDMKCSKCNKQFMDYYSLYRHMKIHSNERYYKCPLCFKDFIENHDLIRHGRFHLGIKNHECLVCEKKFTEKHSLTCHMKAHK